MDAKQIRQLEWSNFTDWEDISRTNKGEMGGLYISKSDIENFVENIFREVARQLNIDYSEIEPILIEENSAFFKAVDAAYGSYKGLGKEAEPFSSIKKMLRIPTVSSVQKKECNVEKILKDFETLTEVEKVEVLERLKLISVHIKYIGD